MGFDEHAGRGGVQSVTERKCSHCGSTDLVTGIQLHQTTTEPGQVGLRYKAWKFLQNTERLYADLCQSCGTVVRFYVKDSHQPWIVDKDQD